jgi:hypothetical protein
MQFGPYLMVTGGKTLPGEVTLIEDDLRVKGPGEALFQEKGLGPFHVVLHDPTAVSHHGLRVEVRPGTALRAVQIDQDFRRQKVIPEIQVSGLAAAKTTAAFHHAHRRPILFHGNDLMLGSKY